MPDISDAECGGQRVLYRKMDISKYTAAVQTLFFATILFAKTTSFACRGVSPTQCAILEGSLWDLVHRALQAMVNLKGLFIDTSYGRPSVEIFQLEFLQWYRDIGDEEVEPEFLEFLVPTCALSPSGTGTLQPQFLLPHSTSLAIDEAGIISKSWCSQSINNLIFSTKNQRQYKKVAHVLLHFSGKTRRSKPTITIADPLDRHHMNFYGFKMREFHVGVDGGNVHSPLGWQEKKCR